MKNKGKQLNRQEFTKKNTKENTYPDKKIPVPGSRQRRLPPDWRVSGWNRA